MFKANYSADMKLPETVEYFKEEMVKELLIIPTESPDVERILDILVWPDIIDYKLIETQKGISNAGQNLTGLKLVVKVRLKEKVTYVANCYEQSVHAAHYESFKNLFVVLPEKIDDVATCKLIKKGMLHVTPYIEGVAFRKISNRCIQKCVMLLVDVEK